MSNISQLNLNLEEINDIILQENNKIEEIRKDINHKKEILNNLIINPCQDDETDDSSITYNTNDINNILEDSNKLNSYLLLIKNKKYKENINNFFEFINFLSIPNEQSTQSTNEEQTIEKLKLSLEYEEVIEYYKSLFTIKSFSSDLFSEYLIEKASNLTGILFDKYNYENSFLIIKNFLLKNTKNILDLVSLLNNDIYNKDNQDQNIKKENTDISNGVHINIVYNFIYNMILLCKKRLYSISNSKNTEKENELELLNDYIIFTNTINQELNNIFILFFESHNEKINKLLSQITLPLYFLIKPYTKTMNLYINIEKEFINEEFKKYDEMNSQHRLLLFKIILESSLSHLKIYISHLNKLSIKLPSSAEIEYNPFISEKQIEIEINKENNLFIHVFEQIILLYRAKLNEQIGYLIKKQVYSIEKVLINVDLLLQTTNIIGIMIKSINDIYTSYTLESSFSNILLDSSKLIENHFEVIFKDFKKKFLDVCLSPNMKKEEFEMLNKEYSQFLNFVIEDLKVSSHSQECIFLYIINYSADVIKKENDIYVKKGFCFKLLDQIISYSDISDEGKDQLCKKINELKELYNI